MRAYFTLQVGHARVAYLKRVFVKDFLQRVALWERILHNAQEFLSHVGGKDKLLVHAQLAK